MPSREFEAKERAAVKLLLEGHSAAHVARQRSVSVHPTTVQRWAAKHGIKLAYPYNRHETRDDLVDVDEIIRLRKRQLNGAPLFTQQEIADMCDCSRSYVKQVCAKARKDGRL